MVHLQDIGFLETDFETKESDGKVQHMFAHVYLPLYLPLSSVHTRVLYGAVRYTILSSQHVVQR